MMMEYSLSLYANHHHTKQSLRYIHGVYSSSAEDIAAGESGEARCPRQSKAAHIQAKNNIAPPKFPRTEKTMAKGAILRFS